MEIIWSPQSLEDVEFIGDYIAQDSPERACLFIDDLISSVERLQQFPESGPIIEDHPIFREVIYNGYRIIYQLRVKKILIITILGPGQLLKK